MGRLIKDCYIKEARIEEILTFKSVESALEYVKARKNSHIKVLYDINFASNYSSPTYSFWNDAFSEQALLPYDDGYLLHVSIPYNNISLNENGYLLSEGFTNSKN